MACATTVQAQPDVPRLFSDTATATAGYFRVSWETAATRVELQEANDPAFRQAVTRYSGPDRATVISGKPDGIWYYRIRAADAPQAGAWSMAVRVAVVHHDLHRALLFFALGVTVFLATLLLIARGPGRAQ